MDSPCRWQYILCEYAVVRDVAHHCRRYHHHGGSNFLYLEVVCLSSRRMARCRVSWGNMSLCCCAEGCVNSFGVYFLGRILRCRYLFSRGLFSFCGVHLILLPSIRCLHPIC